MNQSSTARIGLMAGFLAILYIAILYVVEPQMLVTGYERLTLLIFAGAIIYGLSQMRSTSLSARSLQELVDADPNAAAPDGNDFRSFGDLLQAGFRIYFIAFLLKFAFIYVLFHYYDPSLIDLVRDESTRIYLEQLDPNKDTQVVIEQKVARYREGDFGPSLTDVLGLVIELVIGFIFAAITALFFKREQPDY